MNAEHPFAARRIHTDGRAIFVEAQKETGDLALYDLVRDNFAILDVLVQSFIATVDYDDDEPRRWTPDDRFPRIRIDPLRSFGRPIEIKSGVPAETLFDAWKAEGSDADKVAAWYGTDREGVDQAVHYTLGIPIAARGSSSTRTCRPLSRGPFASLRRCSMSVPAIRFKCCMRPIWCTRGPVTSR